MAPDLSELDPLLARLESAGFVAASASAADIAGCASRQGIIVPAHLQDYFLRLAGRDGVKIDLLQLHGLEQLALVGELLQCRAEVYPGLVAVANHGSHLFEYGMSFDPQDQRIYAIHNCSGYRGYVAENLAAFIGLALDSPKPLGE